MLVTSMIAFVTVFKLEEEITARHQAENKLKKNLKELDKVRKEIERERQKLHAVLSSMGEGLIVCNKAGVISMINYAGGALLRLSPDDVFGKKFNDLASFYYENKNKKKVLPMTIIKQVLEHPDIVTISPNDRLYLQNSGKTAFPVTMVIAPLLQKHENLAIILFRDATREVNIDRAKSEFVSLASHQLRTPLSTMGWYAQMMLAGDAGKINKSQKEFLNEIEESNKRMVELVDSLLNTSRIELGTFSIQPQVVNILDTANSILKELEPQISLKKLNLNVKLPKRVPKYMADPKLLRIIFQNLLTNAVKYTPEKGKVSLNLEIIDEKKKTGHYLLSVEDSGFGIPKNEQHKIFTKMFRATNAQKKTTDGNGLGLYLVKSILDNAGGRIWFTSAENKGATFFVELPLSGMEVKERAKSLS